MINPENWSQLPGAPAPGTVLSCIDDIPEGMPHMLSFGMAPDRFDVILLRTGDQVYAYVNRCAHFGIRLAEKPEHLKFAPHKSVSCNVHYARFRWQDGYCEWGDCEGESLLPIPIEIIDGKVLIA